MEFSENPKAPRSRKSLFVQNAKNIIENALELREIQRPYCTLYFDGESSISLV